MEPLPSFNNMKDIGVESETAFSTRSRMVSMPRADGVRRGCSGNPLLGWLGTGTGTLGAPCICRACRGCALGEAVKQG